MHDIKEMSMSYIKFLIIGIFVLAAPIERAMAQEVKNESSAAQTVQTDAAISEAINETEDAKSVDADILVQEALEDARADKSLSQNSTDDTANEDETTAEQAEKTYGVATEKLTTILSEHPSLSQTEQRVCQAYFGKLQERSKYFPYLDAALSGGDKLIDKTTNSDEFGGSNRPEYDGRGVNMTLTLRQQIYDWGATSAGIDYNAADESVARLEYLQNIDAQISELLGYAFDYVTAERLHQHYTANHENIKNDVAAMEARFRAGAGRISELRGAQVTLLDSEAAVSRAARRRDQAEKALESRFEIDPETARLLVQDFIVLRPDIPEMPQVRETLSWRIFDGRIDMIEYEEKKLAAERKPALYGLLTGKAWDIDKSNRCGEKVDETNPDAENIADFGDTADYRRMQNCYTYEVTGNIEFSVPLYDGGLNKAQRGQTNARRLSLEAERANFERQYLADSKHTSEALRDIIIRLAEQQQKREDVKGQLESELKVQGRTRSTPAQIASLRLQFANIDAEIIELEIQTELERIQHLLLSNQLGETLGVFLTAKTC